MKNTLPLKQLLRFLILPSVLLLFSAGCSHKKKRNENDPNDTIPVRTAKFFTLSDVHFDPFYDTSLVQKLVHADVNDWDAIFRSSHQTGFGVYGKDSNFNLMTGAFSAMHNVNADPDFIVITGDFLSHKFQQTYDTLTGTKMQDALPREAFITKTIEFIALELVKEFPHTPVYPVLGNNDD
ncbi:MAG TPA: metallophosphoesterase, partial [Bacteroidia bacterium]|nr:metallophosphoesterase [Bacteroidia bacterium]